MTEISHPPTGQANKLRRRSGSSVPGGGLLAIPLVHVQVLRFGERQTKVLR